MVDSPFSHHVYLGCCDADAPVIKKLREALEARKIRCFLRCDTTSGVQSTILRGVRCSEKCLVYFSENYLKDSWHVIETQKIAEKGKRFSRDVVIVLKDESAMTHSLPDCLSEYTSCYVPVSPDSLLNAALVEQLTEAIRKGKTLFYIVGP